MDPEAWKVVAEVAGVAGIALAILFLLFRDVIRKQIFPMLTKRQAFALLILVVVLVFLVAVAALSAWVLLNWRKPDSSAVHGLRIDFAAKVRKW